MSLTAEQIQKNYDKHIKILYHYLPEDRAKKCEKMIESFGTEYATAPASSKTWYHNAFIGGYIDHVNRVVQYAIKQKELYEQMGGMIDFTDEELVFSAIFHDLGKVGDKDKPSYIPQTDKWRQDKLHEMFTPNKDLEFMLVPDRSLFTLQSNGIEVSKNEYLAIKLHDGVFSDANKPYWFSNNPHSRMKTSIANVLHTADFLASKVEYDKWLLETGGVKEPAVKKTKASTGRRVNSSKGLNNLLKNI